MLAKDVSNLMLVCGTCHKTIDTRADDYSVELLREMKAVHEERIQRIYDIKETKESIPVLLRHPIKRVHVPQFLPVDVDAAIMANSNFVHMPSPRKVGLDYRDRMSQERDPGYWSALVSEMRESYQAQMHHARQSGAVEHLSICAFAPMPLNMQLGAFVGNKIEATAYQWDRAHESWKFPAVRQFQAPHIDFEDVPPAEGRELAVKLCLSGEISASAVADTVPGLPTVRFGIINPHPLFVESLDDIRHFRTRFGEFMAAIRNRGYRRIHVFPAMPLALAVEFGRQLLPKADPAIDVWDLHGERFIHTLQLQL
jgi:hypothetical protein